MIPIEAATRAGVLVANVPGVNARSVAEHVFFVTMALLRRFRMMDRDLRQTGWLAGRDHADKAHELHGRTLGVVGAGNVGKAVMAIARAGFGLDVIANSRNPKSLPDDVRFVSVDELVAESDIVVLVLSADAGDGRAAQPRPHRPHAAGSDPGQRVARAGGRRHRPDRGAAAKAASAAQRSTSSSRSRCRPITPISRSTT